MRKMPFLRPPLGRTLRFARLCVLASSIFATAITCISCFYEAAWSSSNSKMVLSSGVFACFFRINGGADIPTFGFADKGWSCRAVPSDRRRFAWRAVSPEAKKHVDTHWDLLFVGHVSQDLPSVSSLSGYYFVLWPWNLLLIAASIIFLYREARRSQWTKANKCANCGYGPSPWNSICPECGKMITRVN